MSPKEKAKELVEKMQKSLYSDGTYDAKQCALVAVDEILEIVSDDDMFNVWGEKYWQDVKKDIELL